MAVLRSSNKGGRGKWSRPQAITRKQEKRKGRGKGERGSPQCMHMTKDKALSKTTKRRRGGTPIASLGQRRDIPLRGKRERKRGLASWCNAKLEKNKRRNLGRFDDSFLLFSKRKEKGKKVMTLYSPPEGGQPLSSISYAGAPGEKTGGKERKGGGGKRDDRIAGRRRKKGETCPPDYLFSFSFRQEKGGKKGKEKHGPSA